MLFVFFATGRCSFINSTTKYMILLKTDRNIFKEIADIPGVVSLQKKWLMNVLPLDNSIYVWTA